MKLVGHVPTGLARLIRFYLKICFFKCNRGLTGHYIDQRHSHIHSFRRNLKITWLRSLLIKQGKWTTDPMAWPSSLPCTLPSEGSKNLSLQEFSLKGHFFPLWVYFAFTLSENEVNQSTHHFASAIKEFGPHLEFKYINQFNYLFTILSFISFQNKGIIFRGKEPYKGPYLVVCGSHQLSSVDLSVYLSQHQPPAPRVNMYFYLKINLLL